MMGEMWVVGSAMKLWSSDAALQGSSRSINWDKKQHEDVRQGIYYVQFQTNEFEAPAGLLFEGDP